MIIAYLISTYPMPSQTFIRREIVELERQGHTVYRFAARRPIGDLVDPADRAENERTRGLIEAGAWRLATACLGEAVGRPRAFWCAFVAAFRMGIVSDRGFFRHFVYLAEACLLRGWLEERGVQRLHAHFGANSADIAVLCRLLGGPPYSVTFHGPEEFDAPRGFNLRTKIEHADFAVAISEFTRGQLFRWCRGCDRAKIHVVRCGLDGMFLAQAASRPPIEPRLVNVGRLSEQKGQFLLLEAAARLRDRGVEFELVIVGDGPMRRELEEFIEDRDLGDRVRIMGFLSNEGVRSEMLAARALVLPSLAEGLPVVVMEAFALGRPVISSFVAGIPELIESGTNGWLVPAGAVEPLVEAMQEALAASPEELERMGRAGALRVAQNHDVEHEVGKLIDLFRGTPGLVEIPDETPRVAVV